MGFSQFSRSKAGYELTLSSLKFRIHRVRVKLKLESHSTFVTKSDRNLRIEVQNLVGVRALGLELSLK